MAVVAIHHRCAGAVRADVVGHVELGTRQSVGEPENWLFNAEYPFIRVCDFGHWGDGGVHLNLVWKAEDAPRPTPELKQELQPRIYELAVTRLRGSYSAEHGVGPHNQLFYDRYTPELVKALCRTLKAQLDPQGLLLNFFKEMDEASRGAASP